MAVEIINDKKFEDFIQGDKVVVDCWAEWCGPCKMLAPILEEVSKDMNDVKFGKLNVDENPMVANRYSISSIPTLLLFNKGNLVDQIVGLMPKPILKAKIKDMLD